MFLDDAGGLRKCRAHSLGLRRLLTLTSGQGCRCQGEAGTVLATGPVRDDRGVKANVYCLERLRETIPGKRARDI